MITTRATVNEERVFQSFRSIVFLMTLQGVLPGWAWGQNAAAAQRFWLNGTPSPPTAHIDRHRYT